MPAEKNEQRWRADETLPRHLSFGGLVIAFLVCAVGGWAGFASIGGAVIAPGSIAIESFSKTVQHLEGGIVSEIAVKDGDLISTGDLLVKLDSGQLAQQFAGLTSQLESKALELKLLQAELADLKHLLKKGLVPKTRVTALKRQAARIKGEQGSLTADIARVKAKLQGLEIRAPISGYVHDLAFHTIGGVVSPGQGLLQIVPARGELMIQAKIAPQDIDQVRKGQPAIVRLTSFNQRTTPEVTGSVVHISADLTRDDARRTPYYTVHIDLTGHALQQLGDIDLIPGMPAESFIQTERRTALSYLFRPVADHFTRAFREE